MRASGYAAWATLLVLGLGSGLVACREGAEETRTGSGARQSGAIDGLSREQIEQQVQPMSPEQAESLGIVDTTIHVESLQAPEDSLLVATPDTSDR